MRLAGRGLKPFDFVKAARALGLKAWGYGQSLSAWDMQQHLPKSPLWVAGQWFPFGLHARLVIAVSDDMVDFFDPWYGGTYGMDLQHQDLLDNFVHGDRANARGTDKLIGSYQLSFWMT
jgi:hypothetical protein